MSSSLDAGKSVLWLSNSRSDPYASVKDLTMIRTNDGTILWKYHLQGTLANGYAHQTEDQLRAGTAVRIVNGMVYFAEVLHADASTPAMTTFSLTALKADTGAILWRHQMMATTLEIMGIDNGLLVSLMTVGSNSQVDALTAAGYRAETGALVWQRQIAQHISYGNPPDQLFGGTLYVELAPAWTVLAIDARTGKQLWKYFWQPIEQKVFTVSVYPLTAGNGVVVFAGATGPSLDQLKANFRALRQSDGALVWRKEVSKPGGFQGGLGSPIQTDGNLLYFATNVPEQNDLELNALQVSSGTLLWHQRIATRPTLNMLSLGLANGVLYAPYQFNAQRNTHGLVIQAVQAKSGTLLWQARLETSGALVALGDGMNASTMINATDSGRSYTSVVALNTANGTTFWHNAGEGFGGIIADGKVVAFVHRVHQGDFRQQLCALQPDTGTSLWCHDADGFNNWVIAAT